MDNKAVEEAKTKNDIEAKPTPQVAENVSDHRAIYDRLEHSYLQKLSEPQGDALKIVGTEPSTFAGIKNQVVGYESAHCVPRAS